MSGNVIVYVAHVEGVEYCMTTTNTIVVDVIHISCSFIPHQDSLSEDDVMLLDTGKEVSCSKDCIYRTMGHLLTP